MEISVRPALPNPLKCLCSVALLTCLRINFCHSQTYRVQNWFQLIAFFSVGACREIRKLIERQRIYCDVNLERECARCIL
jgi:hypothetical protein